ncbi:MAG TPA: ATP-binding protein, partial [Lysobacter sp.]
AGDVWLARFGAVERHRLRQGRLQRLDRLGGDAGFPRVAPSGLVVDANGIVWVTSVRGLARVDPLSRRVRVYGVRDGLPSQEFAGAPVARPGDGRILLGAPEGLVVFDPSVVRPAAHAPRLFLESIDVRRGDRRVALDPDAPVELRDGDRDLRVRARLMSFNNAGVHAYRFRLRGFDRGWVDAGADGERVFSQLPAGRYRLQVAGRGADQVWSAPRSFDVGVRPPWWRTAWAYASLAALAALLAWTIARAIRERLHRRMEMQRIEHERRLAQQASEAKTRFLATFGHEVRTPMTGVLGMTELLLDTPLDARQRGYVGSIRTAGEHLLRLLNDALDLARIDSGRLEIADEPFDLHRMLHEVAALTQPLAARRGLAFAHAVAPDVPRRIVGDCSRLRQILLNLLGNAVKFTERGSIALRVARHGDGLRFSVDDTGPGLSPGQAAHLFRRFQQADGLRTAARYGGSGLGLAISAELAEAMGGRIAVESVPGEGASFHVDLPLREAMRAADATSTPVAAREAAPPRSLSILLVEDDPTVAAVVRGLLEAQGHRVRHVVHGLAALAEAGIAGYDVALLDHDLPGMDGFALARQLRLHGFAAPLVAVTARADAGSEPQARAAGFDRFVRKPVTGAMLAEVLAAVARPMENAPPRSASDAAEPTVR